MIQILITDKNLVPLGDPLTSWQSLDIVGRFNEPGSGSFSTPATPAVMAQLVPGARVLVIRDGVEFISGPIEKPGPYQWSIEDGDNAGYGSIAITFAEDDALIAARVSYPDPAAAATAQTVTAYYTKTGVNAELVLRDVVNKNAGPGALVARRIPKLALGTLASVGTNVTITSRWEALGDLLRRVALAGGGLGYRTRQVGAQILFEVYQPSDLSRQIRFSRGLGNLRSVTYDPASPVANAIIVGGQGDLTARTIREVVDTSSQTGWGRLEKFLDQTQTDQVAELDAAGADALLSNGESVRLQTVTVDTPTQRYGVHYGLGDQVSVEYLPGVEQVQVVRSFHLQASPASGEYITVTIGTQESSNDPAIVRLGHDLDRRLSRIERR